MILVYLILLTLIILTILLFVSAMRIRLVFDSDRPEMNMKLLWLDPFVNAFITIENTLPILKVYLFKKLVFDRALDRSKKRYKGTELVRISNPQDINVNVQYGFSDPFTTGIACGVINLASQLAVIESVNQAPDFMSNSDYIHLDATAKVNLGSALIRFLKSRQQMFR